MRSIVRRAKAGLLSAFLLVLTMLGMTAPALAISAISVTQGGSGNDAATFTTAPISPLPNTLYVIDIVAMTSEPPNTPTVSGGGFSSNWVLIRRADVGGPRALFSFRNMQSSGASSGPITIDFAGQGIDACAWIVDEISGTLTTGDRGADAIVQSQHNPTTAFETSGSVGLAGFADATNNVAYAAFAHGVAEATAPTTAGAIELGDVTTGPNDLGLESHYVVGERTSMGASWSTPSHWLGIGMEIRAGADSPVAPAITSFSPTSGPVGTSVTVNGSNFAGATAVMFNGVAATFTEASQNTLSATVPSEATTGPISVTTPSGTATSPTNFTITALAVHSRKLTLRLTGQLVAKGNVSVTDGFARCVQGVPIKVQRRVEENWRTVATGLTRTSGSYQVMLIDRAGRYRARAARLTLSSGDLCAGATSGIERNTILELYLEHDPGPHSVSV